MNPKQSMRIMVALLAVVFLGGLYYLYTQVKTAGDRWPSLNAPGSLTARINGLQKDIADLKKEVDQIPAAREELAALQVEYELAARVLPSESTPDQLIGAIRTKAQQAGVEPSKLTPTVVKPRAAASRRRGQQATGKFEEWRFSLTIAGSYDQIANFINRMEEFESNDPQRVGAERRFFQVQSIDIAAAGNGLASLTPASEADRINRRHICNLVMQTYRYTGEDQKK